MEPANKYPRPAPPNRNWGGLILILIGLVFLLKKLPGIQEWIPIWIFSWPSILIVVGLFIGVKNRFKNVGAFILIGIGLFFLLENAMLIQANMRPYIWPIGLMILGVIVLSRRNSNSGCRNKQHKHYKRTYQPTTVAPDNVTNPEQEELANKDRIEVNSVFGNINRSLFSKNFTGGNINATFGGAEINLSKCDFQGNIIIDISVVFGGVELVIPSNWNLNNEVNVIMGGIEDKRNLVSPAIEGAEKTLTLRGTIICGGLELKSF